jgi:hypothetical protein
MQRYAVDVLPFTRDEFFTVFESYDAAVWPAQLVLYAFAVVMVVWAARRSQRTDRWLPFGLAALWLWTGVLCHWRELTAVNRMAWVFGALFVAQGVLFAVAGARGVGCRSAVLAACGVGSAACCSSTPSSSTLSWASPDIRPGRCRSWAFPAR